MSGGNTQQQQNMMLNPSRNEITEDLSQFKKTTSLVQTQNKTKRKFVHSDDSYDSSDDEQNKEEKESTCSSKCVSIFCCHRCGSDCCKRGTRSRRCGKKFFKTLSVGQINNGLYFGRSQQYLSVVSGIFTILGALVLVTLSIKVFLDIFSYSNISAKLVYESYDIKRDTISLFDFLQRTNIQFKVKAYNFWDLDIEPLDCTEMDASLLYMIPNGTDPINLPMVCNEVNQMLMFKVPINGVDLYQKIIIENMQYFRLNIEYKGGNFIEDKTKLYLLYKGKNILFTGDNIVNTDFTSLELPFGTFYKTQMSPFMLRNVSNLWQLGIPSLRYDNHSNFQFPSGLPYYVDNYFGQMDNRTVRMFLKYNNDNNPFQVVTITPVTVFGGLTKIGGYITIFGLLKIALYLYNRHSFENRLLKKYRQKIKETFDEDDTRKIDKDTIRQLMSYEMLMELVLNYLKDQKDFRLSGVTKESLHSIQHGKEEQSSVDDEEMALKTAPDGSEDLKKIR